MALSKKKRQQIAVEQDSAAGPGHNRRGPPTPEVMRHHMTLVLGAKA